MHSCFFVNLSRFSSKTFSTLLAYPCTLFKNLKIRRFDRLLYRRQCGREVGESLLKRNFLSTLLRGSLKLEQYTRLGMHFHSTYICLLHITFDGIVYINFYQQCRQVITALDNLYESTNRIFYLQHCHVVTLQLLHFDMWQFVIKVGMKDIGIGVEKRVKKLLGKNVTYLFDMQRYDELCYLSCLVIIMKIIINKIALLVIANANVL